MRPTSVGAGTRLHPAGIHDSCSFSFPLSLKQFLAVNHLLLFQELLGFVPCRGLGTLQLPKWGLTKTGRGLVAGCQEGGCQEPGADGGNRPQPLGE